MMRGELDDLNKESLKLKIEFALIILKDLFR